MATIKGSNSFGETLKNSVIILGISVCEGKLIYLESRMLKIAFKTAWSIVYTVNRSTQNILLIVRYRENRLTYEIRNWIFLKFV